jgi:hypothetical protein
MMPTFTADSNDHYDHLIQNRDEGRLLPPVRTKPVVMGCLQRVSL